MFYILDTVLRDIGNRVAAFAPERGGAVLGLIGKPVLTRFLFDEDAKTTGATYQPSRTLARRVKDVELAENLEFKGILHSHPGGMNHPSSQDEYELGVGLEINTHMAFYLAPIVTSMPMNGKLGANEMRVGDGRISFFIGLRHRTRKVEVQPLVNVFEVPMEQDLERVRSAFGGSITPEVFVTNLAGVEMLAGRVVLDGGLELLFLTSELYPAIPPLLLVTSPGHSTKQMQIPWPLEVAPEQRLVEAIRHIVRPPGPYCRVFGPIGGPALTLDSERARLAGWTAFYSSDSIEQETERIQRGISARAGSLVFNQLKAKRALVVGVGSVGSYFVEQLARNGVGAFTLVDPEQVEYANLSRTVYDFGDVGRPKVEAMARHLLHINPSVALALHHKDLLDVTLTTLDSLVLETDLVVAATDDLQAQRALNRFAYACKRPAIFVGLYAGARGGEVIISLPEQTACYLCATSTRHTYETETSRVSTDVDYGTGRLKGEIALGVDIHHVTTTAVKMGLSLLLPTDAEGQLNKFLTRVVEEGSTYLTLSMVPDYWFYPHVFGQTPGQHAYQSVWITPTRNPSCPVCGDASLRIGRLEVPLRSPRKVPE
jgi:molybdopterin/thiamine biosynthesis adenylyltransferase